jgi:hypothetical protein
VSRLDELELDYSSEDSWRSAIVPAIVAALWVVALVAV